MAWRRLVWPAALLPLLLALPAAPCLGLPAPAALALGALPLGVVVVLALRDRLPACACPSGPRDAWAGGVALLLFLAALVGLDRFCP